MLSGKSRAGDADAVHAEARADAAIREVIGRFRVSLHGDVVGKAVAQACRAGRLASIIIGYGPLAAGLRTLPWTAMPVLVAPLAGPLSDRIGGRPLLVAGLVLQGVGIGWLGLALTEGMSYSSMLIPFILSGVGMGLFFVPVASVVMGSVPADMQGVASGTNNGIRELGGVLGIAVLGAIFSARGGFTSGQSFVDGLHPALIVGGAGVLVGAAAAAFIPRRTRPVTPASASVEPVLVPA